MLVKCQPDSGNVAKASFSKALASFVKDDSEPTGNAEFGGHINPRCVPLAPFLDQQRRTAVPSGPRAIVTQQQPAAGIGRASDNAALGIRHQNKRVILLIAAEHDDTPD